MTRVFLSVAIILSAMTLAYVWPLPMHMSDVVPTELADPLLNAFLYDHVFGSIARGEWSAVWNPPIFWPRTNVLAMSECFLGTVWYGVPLWALTSDPIQLHNWMTVVGLFFSALAASWLGKEITGSWWLGLVVGVTWGFAPFHSLRPQHTQFAHGWGLPLAALGLLWVHRGKPCGWMVASVSIALQVLSCSYLGVYGGLMLLPVAVVLFFRGSALEFFESTSLWFLAAFFAFVAILFVPSLHYAAMVHEMGPRDTVWEPLSFPSLIAVLLMFPAAAGARRGSMSEVASVVGFAAVLLVLVPLLRVPTRSLFVTALPVGVVAALGVQWILKHTAERFESSWGAVHFERRLWILPLASLAIFATSLAPVTLVRVPPTGNAPGPVLHLPFRLTGRAALADLQAARTHQATFNGYSGYMPPESVSLRYALPEDQALIERLGARSVVTHVGEPWAEEP